MELNARKIVGLRELKRAMNTIPYEVKKDKFFLAVFRLAAKPIIQAARAKIDDDEGDLRRSIKAFTTRRSRKLPALYVGPKATGGRAKKNKQRGGGFYGAMVEYGTVHSSPHPFMRPAWELKQGEAMNILLKGATTIVNKVIERELKGQKRLYT
jgi:HK97 gp10 family phage protein|tara:strand:+ start:432 stop:893 length:462 start_codon:yes stop_codon:yes gene_type:complete